jgi:dipeptidyl aminopeptidase/acylaminoacyl peptidase
MRTEVERRVRAGLREYADAVTVTPPPVSAVTVAPPGPNRRRRFGRPAFAAAAMVAIVALLPAALPRADHPSGHDAASGGSVSLPRRFASFSFLTGDLAEAPIDRAVAVYVQRNNTLEDEHQDWQVLLLDADGSRYRRTRAVDFSPSNYPLSPGGVEYRPGLLSADGRMFALGGENPAGRRELSVLSVATGTVTRHALPAGVDPRPLAWSPDGRVLAYTATTANSATGPLSLLDVETGKFTTVSGIDAAQEAAFSPDGSQMAVQVGSEILIVDHEVEGKVQRRLPLAADQRLSGSVAWSPDGTLLALTSFAPMALDAGGTRPAVQAVAFVDATGRKPSASVPAPIPVDRWTVLQGWRTSRAIVVWDAPHLAQVPLDGTARTTLADASGEVADLQLASGLLTTMTVTESGKVDRGPWPSWAKTTLGFVLGAPALTAAALLLWWRARRRVPVRPQPDKSYQ